jgi:hypothetical protein
MTATYTNDPVGNPIDQIRLLVGDTDVSDALLQDAEILFFLSQDDNVYKAAAIAARSIAGKLVRSVTETKFDDVSQKTTPPSAHYLKLADALDAQANKISSRITLGLFAGGTSVSQMEAVRNDPDRAPGFWDNQFDAPPSPGVRK